MKISELFERTLIENKLQLLSESQLYQLFEDLGNLKQVDSEFMNLIKQSITYGKGYRGGDRPREIAKTLPIYLGRDSKAETVSVKSGADIHRLINDQDNVKALVILFDGVQSFAILKTPTDPNAKYSNSPTYFWVGSWQKIFNNDDLGPMEEITAKDHLAAANVLNLKTNEGDEKRMYKALTALLKAKKEIHSKSEITALVISADEKRASAQNSRMNARSISGDKEHLTNPPEVHYKKRTPENADYETRQTFSDKQKTQASAVFEFEKKLKNRLSSRLNTFKEHKAPKAESPEELLNLIKKDGFLEKIKINGFVYIQRYENIRWSSLVAQQKTGKASDYDRSYIEYNMETFSSSAAVKSYYDEMETIRKAIKAKYPDDPEKADEEIEQYRMPDSIKVYLKLEKSSIVVDEVSVKSFKKWEK